MGILIGFIHRVLLLPVLFFGSYFTQDIDRASGSQRSNCYILYESHDYALSAGLNTAEKGTRERT